MSVVSRGTLTEDLRQAVPLLGVDVEVCLGKPSEQECRKRFGVHLCLDLGSFAGVLDTDCARLNADVASGEESTDFCP